MRLLLALTLYLCSLNVAIAGAVVQQHTLDNGLKVLLIEAHNVPMVAMKLVLPAGSRFDAKDKGGSDALFGERPLPA